MVPDTFTARTVFYAALCLPAILPSSRARSKLVNLLSRRVPYTSSPPLKTATSRVIDFLTESPLSSESHFLVFPHSLNFTREAGFTLFLAGSASLGSRMSGLEGSWPADLPRIP